MKGKNKFISFKSMFFMLIAFITFFVVSNNSKIQAACHEDLGAIKITATLSDTEAGTITIPNETCKSGLVWDGWIPNKKNYEITISVVLKEGYFFEGWFNTSTNKIVSEAQSYTTTYSSDVNYIAKVKKMNVVVRGTNSSEVYESLEEALESGTSPLYLVKPVTISSDLVIPSNVTLVLPHTNGVLEETTKGTAETAIKRVPWSTQENIDKYRNLNVIIENGATLTVNGTLVIAAVQHYPHQSNPQGLTSGAYSQITNNGNIIVNGTMKVYGLLSGNGTLTINNGAKLYEPFLINDFSGGQNTEAFVKEKQMPFKQFAMVNIHCHQYINYGAIVYGVSSIYARILISTEITIQEVPIIGTDYTNAIFALNDSTSSIEISYNAKTIAQKLGDTDISDSGVSIIKTHGNITFGQFKLAQYDVNSSELGFLGLPYTFNVIIGSDSIANIKKGYNYKLLPGGLLKVEEGGVLNIDSEATLLIYDGLIQADKSGKQYPDAATLSKYNFSKNAVFILNGTLNINGAFAGIIQTEGTATINTSSSSILNAEVVDGAVNGHSNSLDNQTVFDMTTRVYGLTGYIDLEPGKTYKGFSNDSFILSTFTVKDAGEYTGDLSITMNQPMQGRILEWNGSEYITTVTYYIGEKISDIEISIDGSNQKTDTNGMITISHTFYKNEVFNYYTVDQEESNTLHSIVLTGINESYFTLNKVIKSIILNGAESDGSYRKYEDETYDITATVTYYGNTSSTINITEPTLTGEFIVNKDVKLTSGTYNVQDNIRTLINIPRSFELYNNKVLALKASSNLVNDASALWKEYLSYLDGRNTDDTNIINGELIHDYGSLIITSISIGQVTYGDTEAIATATTIKGNTTSVTVYSSGYTISPLSTEFTYSSDYLGNVYSYTVKPTRINSKVLKISVNDKTVIYGNNAQLTIEFLDETSYLVNNDTLEEVFSLTREEGNNVGTYDIYANLIHPGYTVESINDATYTINKRDITITINKHANIMLSKALNTTDFDVAIEGKGTTNPEIILNISNDNGLIASITNNALTVMANKTYGVGSYTIEADVLAGKDNYNITTISSSFTVVEDIEYYTVTFEYSNDNNYIYDGSKTTVTVTATYTETGTKVASYTTTMTGPSSEEIINAGTYIIDVDIEHLTYTSTFTVARRTLTLNLDKNEFDYNDNVQQPYFYLTNVVEGDKVNVGTETKDTINAGTYTVSATTLTGDDSDNYVLPEVKTMSYEINKLDITVNTSRHSNIMLSKVTNNITFDTIITGDNGLIDNLVYEVRKGDELIALVENGIVTVENGKTYGTGTYEIYARIDSVNYNVTERVSGSITVVEDIEYYTVTFEYSNDNNYIYDGSKTTVTVTATYTETGDSVASYTTTMTGPSSEEIINAGTYTIDVDIEHLTYTSTFTVAKRTLTLNLDKNEFDYNDNVQQPYFYLTNVVEGDKVNVGTETKDTVNAGTYTVSATTLSGDDSNNYVLPEVKTMSYEINKLDITVNTSRHSNIMLSKVTNNITFDTTITGDNGLIDNLVYEVRKGDELIALVENSIVTVENGKTYGTGTYEIYAKIDSVNYNVTERVSGSITVVEDIEYYTVTFEYSNDNNYIYDGSKTTVTVTATYTETGDSVASYTTTMTGPSSEEIINAGTYTIDVDIEHLTYTSTFTVAKRTLTLNLDKNEFDYNANVQQPYFYLTNVVGGDKVNVGTETKDTINAGTYTVSATTLTGDNSNNYELPEVKTMSYEIKAFSAMLSLENHSDIMLKNKDKIVDFKLNSNIPESYNPNIIYEIRLGEEVIAEVIDGNAITKEGKTYGVNTYTVYPIITNGIGNYNVNVSPGLLRIVENNDYYKVVVAFYNGTTKIDRHTYDANYINTSVEVFVNDTNAVVNNFNYNINGENISTFNQAGTYAVNVTVDGIDYSNAASIVISKRILALNLDKNEFDYNANVQQPYFYLTNVVEGDKVNVGTETKDTINAGTYTVSATTLTGDDSDNYVLPEVKTMSYEINKLDITVNTSRHSNIMLSKVTNNITFDTIITGDNGLIDNLVYEVRRNDELIALVENGIVTVENGKTYGTGTYEIYARIDPINYNVTDRVSGSITVVEDIEYYTVTFEYSNDNNYIYDGSETTVIVTATYTETGDKVASYTTTMTGPSSKEIINAGTYTIDVDIEHLTYTSTFTVAKRTLTLNLDKNEFDYNANVQQPYFYLTNVVEGDKVNVVTETKDTINAGTYTVSATTLTGDDSNNYVLPEVKTMSYEIKRLDITVNTTRHSNIMLSKVTNNITFDTIITGDNGLIDNLVYEVRRNDELIALVENGIVTVENGKTYGIGTYEIYARIDSVNYNVTDRVSGAITVVEDKAYYDVEILFLKDGISIESAIYDGKEIEVEVNVYIAETGESFEDFTYQIIKPINRFALRRNIGEVVIKNASHYAVVVTVEDVVYDDVADIVVEPKKLTLGVDSTEFTYNGEQQQSKFFITGMIEGDNVDVETSTNDSVNAGSKYEVYATLIGDDISNYILPENNTQTYTIKPLDIKLDVARHNNIMLSTTNNEINFDLTITGNNGLTPEVIYEIRKNNELIATVENGVVTVQEGKIYGTGTYEVYARVDSSNYNVSEYSLGSITVVEDNEYYEVNVSFVKNNAIITSAIYDGTSINTIVEVKVKETGEIVKDYSFTVNGSSNASLIDADNYSVDVIVGNVEYKEYASMIITKRELDVKVDTTSFIYNGYSQYPKFELVNVAIGDNISISARKNTINVGDYSITAEISGSNLANYDIVGELTRSYTIKPLSITVTIKDSYSVYGNPLSLPDFECNDRIVGADNIYNFITLTKEPGLSVGTYDIIGTNSNSNYEVNFLNEKDSYTITAKNITVAIDNVEVLYGEDEVDLTASVTLGELSYQDALYDLITLTREEGNGTGIYRINANNNSLNYNITFTSATYKIKARDITVKINNSTSVYGNKFSALTLDIINGSMAQNEDIYDIVEITSNYKSDVGIYDIVANKIENSNYNITISYTGAGKSLYEVTKRPITIKVNDIEVDNDITYDYLNSLLSYEIINGNTINGDSLNIDLSVKLHSGVTLTNENFDTNFSGGVHEIHLNAHNSNYDITIINGNLNVTKCIVTIHNLNTVYTYDDGKVIVPFNWEENISGYDNSATSNSFGYTLTMKNSNGSYIPVSEIINAGEYRITISIIHTHAYEFNQNPKTTYDILVNRKDISNDIEFYNIPTNNIKEYHPLGITPGVELPNKYAYINYIETLTYNDEIVYEALNVGMYEYSVEIDDDNYTGRKVEQFEIIKKDISNMINVNINDNDSIHLDRTNEINVTIEKYNVDFTIIYEQVPSTIIEYQIGDTGIYKMHMAINDNCYMGEKIITINVIPSISHKIQILKDLISQFDLITSNNDKDEILEQMGDILTGFVKEDTIVIEANDEYKKVVNEAKEDYQNYLENSKNIGSTIDTNNNNKFNMTFVWIGIAVSLMLIILSIYIYKVNKRRKMKTL